ncbi:MAG: hypothetical protein ACI92E_000411 [Oceanicoccus sp.]|jgi:hypothetical protein
MLNATPSSSLDSNQKLRLIRRKRHALEQLINFSKNILQQEQALDDLLLLSKPSQSIPDKIRRDLIRLVDSQQELSDHQLQERLARVDPLVQSGTRGIMAFTQSIEEIDPSNRDIFSKIDHLKEVTSRFRKRAKLAIALRLSLQERGLVTERIKLDFDQDSLADRIFELKNEEKKCRGNIGAHLQDMVVDCENMLAVGKIPKQVQDELVLVKEVMLENIKHLKSGKSLDTMPVNFEIIDIEESAPVPGSMDGSPFEQSDSNLPAEDQQKSNAHQKTKLSASVSSDSNNIEIAESQKKLDFFTRFGIWLNSPWSVTWGRTKRMYKNRPRKKR